MLLVIKRKRNVLSLLSNIYILSKIHTYVFLSFFLFLCSVLYFNLYFRSLTLFLLKQSHGLFFHSFMHSFEE